jgi:hypothetical protein
MNRSRHRAANAIGAFARAKADLRCCDARYGTARGERRVESASRKQPGDFIFHRRANALGIRGRHREAVEYQSLDVQVDPHATLTGAGGQRKSGSWIGRSSLRNSLRAASRMSGIVTWLFACAATKAALSAISAMCRRQD